MKNLHALMSSPPDRENAVFEIWLENEQLAEVSKEPGRSLDIQIYSRPGGDAWDVDLLELMSVLEKAAKNLGG